MESTFLEKILHAWKWKTISIFSHTEENLHKLQSLNTTVLQADEALGPCEHPSGLQGRDHGERDCGVVDAQTGSAVA